MKNILLTGVSKGLGLNICKVLLDNNYFVYGVSRNTTQELNDLLANNKNFIHIPYDLTDVDGVKNKLLKKELLFDVPIHGFINNAALAYDDIVTNLNLSKLETMYSVNVFSPMLITKFIIRNMLLFQTKGSIIHISSISAHTGYKGLSMYASTKGALEAFSKNVAREWGEKGIRSNCIVAGFMETSMSESLTSDQKNRIYQRTSLKKPTNPETIAYMIEYLLSDKSSSITGQNLFVDSGTI
jgi:3-oxoacyl-[acyl-carrier protein] reductase